MAGQSGERVSGAPTRRIKSITFFNSKASISARALRSVCIFPLKVRAFERAVSWARQRGRNMAFSDSFDRRCRHHPTPAPLYATRRKTIPCRIYRQHFRHEPGGVAPRPPRSRSWFLRPRLALALPLARTLPLVWPRLDPSRRSLGPARPAGGVPGRGRPRAPGQAEGGSAGPWPWLLCRARHGAVGRGRGTTRLTSAATHTHTQGIKPRGQGGKKKANEFQAILARRQEGTVVNIPPDEADTLPLAWAPPQHGTQGGFGQLCHRPSPPRREYRGPMGGGE